MGWWGEEEKGTELTIGDEPVDVAIEMVDRVLSAYESEMGRKPTMRELARTIEIALVSRVDRVVDSPKEGEYAPSVAIKLRVQKKRRRCKAGEYFAVPLSDGRYGFGRVVDVMVTTLLLLDFFAVRSEKLLGVAELENAPVLWKAVCGYLGLSTGEWPVLGMGAVEDVRQGRLDEELHDHLGGLSNVTESPGSAREILEWRLDGNRGDPWD